MADTTSGTNDGDDLDKENRGAAQGGQYDVVMAGDPYPAKASTWYDLAPTRALTPAKLNSLPPAITSLSMDSQGRLLVGTSGGIWRGIGFGFGYDFNSGGTASSAGRRGHGGPPPSSAPAMNFTSINGNLQIADMTSVAVDPFNRGVLYTTQTTPAWPAPPRPRLGLPGPHGSHGQWQ